MKIIEQTDSVLVLQNTKTLAIVFSVVLIVLLSYLFYRFWSTTKVWYIVPFLFFPCMMIFGSVTTRITFDKGAGTLFVTLRGIVINKDLQYDLSEIEKVKLQEFWGTSTMALGMKDGSAMYIHGTRSGVFWGGKNFHGFGLWNMANSLSQFLSVPLAYTYPGMDRNDPLKENYPEAFRRRW